MNTRLFLAAGLAALLAGCATYSNDYRDSYSDGSYYSPADSENGDYYYAPERSDPYYSYGYDRGFYDYRYSLGPIGYGRFDGYCSVQFSSCAPYWYGYSSYSPSYSRYGFSLFYGSNRWFNPWGYRHSYSGYGYRSAPIYRGTPRGNYPRNDGVGRGSRLPPQTVPNWSSSPRRPGNYPRQNNPRRNDPANEPPAARDTPSANLQRPLYRANRPVGAENQDRSPRPMPKPYQRIPQPDPGQDSPPPVYRQPRAEPRPMPAPTQPAWHPQRSTAPASGPAEESSQGGRARRNHKDERGG